LYAHGTGAHPVQIFASSGFARLAIEQLILRREKVDAGLDYVRGQCMADVNCTVYT
jgi:hypothetical protein